MLKLIDAHAHLNFPDYDSDREAVLARAAEAGIGVVNVGTDLETSKRAVELAQNRENIWATVGVHPTDFAEALATGGNYWSEMRKLARLGRVVAIGECGLDYFRSDPSTSSRQKEIFIKQIELANELNLALMLHIRDAYKESYEILKSRARVRGNVHFFAGTWEEARLFLDLGFTLSFTGVVTFARNYDETIKNVPLDMILVETDCPFVAPVPHRGRRNEPLYVREVARQIAAIKGLDYETVTQATLRNTERFFGLTVA